MATKKTVKRPTSHHGATPTDPLAARAQQATDLKYGPDLSALHQLGADTTDQYRQGVSQSRAAADSIVAGVNESSSGLADFLARAAQRSAGTLSAVQPGALTPKLANEAALVQRNNNLDLQSVAAQLANTKVRAREGAQYQGQHLYSQYQQDLGKINSQASALAGQAGSYAQSVYQSLLDDKATNDLKAKQIASTARNAALGRATTRLTAGVDQNGQVIPGSPKAISLHNQTTQAQAAKTAAAARRRAAAAGKPNAPDANGNTPKQRTAAQDSYTKASLMANTYKVGFTPAEGWQALYKFLVTAKNLNPPEARAAAQRAFNVPVDPATTATLAKRGIKIPAFVPPPKPKAATITIGPAGFPQIIPGT